MLNSCLIKYNSFDKNDNNIFFWRNFRITLLTDKIVRVEKSENKVFLDNMTKSFVFRNTDDVDYSVKYEKNRIFVTTKSAIFSISNNLKFSVSFDGGKSFVKEKDNLFGTRRTLDFCFSKVKLEKGLLSKVGFSTFDDSNSPIFDNGLIKNREFEEKDIYLFASLDYLALLKDFYLISGKTPMLPRYAFGNFWSRYYPYSDTEYICVMQKFKDKKIPFSVAVIDMDWHYVNLKKDFPDLYKDFPNRFERSSLGWTGYTFNKNLFPDHKKFLSTLHNMGLSTTLNIHPAQGVLPHEDAYQTMKEKLGAEEKGIIPFNFENEKFINSYFEDLHKPLENDGVDFWWIDWQQGKKTKHCGLDPLFSLNHYHYLFSERENKRGLILSRFSNLGSQRYPLGFSGDSFINFPILKFIPYFTSTASNVGFSLWSHDIGGHMFGKKDEELYVRWLQFGCFSPINRLHSSNMALTGKEPWKVDSSSERISTKYLRLRHKLIPYLYSEYRNNVENGVPLLRPLYYYYEEENSYKYKNEYLFGDNLLVMPITSKTDKASNLAVEKAFVPENDMFDIFTRKTYQKQVTYFSRELSDTPLLLKKGGIVPLNRNYMEVKNPDDFEVIVSVGDGKYSLYEDDGVSRDYESGKFAITNFDGKLSGGAYTLSISTSNDSSLLPNYRSYMIKTVNVFDAESCILSIDGKEKLLTKKVVDGIKIFFEKEDDIANFDMENEIIPSDVVIFIPKASSCSLISITLSKVTILSNGTFEENSVLFFSKLNGGNIKKTLLFRKLKKAADKSMAKKIIRTLNCGKNTKTALIEIADYSNFVK